MDQIKPLLFPTTSAHLYPWQGAGVKGIYFPISVVHIKERKSEGKQRSHMKL